MYEQLKVKINEKRRIFFRLENTTAATTDAPGETDSVTTVHFRNFDVYRLGLAYSRGFGQVHCSHSRQPSGTYQVKDKVFAFFRTSRKDMNFGKFYWEIIFLFLPRWPSTLSKKGYKLVVVTLCYCQDQDAVPEDALVCRNSVPG